jgi:hypothetical protein
MDKKVWIVILVPVFLLVLAIGYVFLPSQSYSRPNEKKVNLNWQKINSKPTFNLTEADIFRDNVTFLWNSKTYKASNTTPKQQYITAPGEYFRLSENDNLILSLNEEKNEMRYSQFTDCKNHMCIWGLDIHNSDNHPYTPPIDLYLILLPEKKEYSFSNPCHTTNQIDMYSINEVSPQTFSVKIQCVAYSSSDKHEYYESTIDLTTLK